MPWHRVVFVLGAGASKAYGYPLGPGLVELMQGPLQAESPLVSRHDEFVNFRDILRHSGCNSIDVFLESRPDLADIGVALILDRLQGCEDSGKLFPQSDNSIGDNWYKYLFNALLPDGSTWEDAINLNVQFVTFNYDRSLECFWFTALMNRFKKSEAEVRKALERLPMIVHVYGDIGPLKWQSHAADIWRDYHTAWTAENFKACTSRVSLLNSSQWSDNLTAARGAIAMAERIYFLGFGYHPTNMKRLRIDFAKPGVVVRGSGFRLSRTRKKVLQGKYKGLWLGSSDHGISDFLENCLPFLKDVTGPL